MRHISLCIIMVLALVSAIPSLGATITVSAAGGNWSTTACWVGGNIPSVGDAIVIGVSSGSSTVDAGFTNAIVSLDMRNFTGSLTVASSVTLTVAATANESCYLGGTVTGAGSIYLNANANDTMTFYSNGCTNTLATWRQNQGSGNTGTILQGDAFTDTLSTSTLGYDYGTQSSQGFAVTAGEILFGAYAGRTSTLTGSALTINAAESTCWSATATGTTTITNCPITVTIAGGNSTTFAGAGLTYNNLTITGSAISSLATFIITGTNTFATVSVTGYVKIEFPISVTTTMTAFTAAGSGYGLCYVYSGTSGTTCTISVASGSPEIEDCTVRDITAQGGATWNAYNSTSTSNNNGITFKVWVLYCSQQHGSNTYNGGAATLQADGVTGPKLTLTGTDSLTTMMTAACTAYVGPGTYREAFTFGANNQTLTFDSGATCSYLTGDTPGLCRVTEAAVTTELPSTAQAFKSSTYTGCTVGGYSYAYPLYVDGCSSSSLYVMAGSIGANLLTCNNIMAQSCFNCFKWCSCTNCYAGSNYVGYYGCNATNCIGVGGYTATFEGDTLSATAHTLTNCTAIGGTIGYSGQTTTALTLNNDLAIHCATAGFYGSGSGGSNYLVLNNCAGLMCSSTFDGVDATNKLAIGTSFYGVGAQYTGTVSGTATACGIIDLDMAGLLKFGLYPINATGVFELGTATGAPATDIIGNSTTSPPSIGAYQPAAATRTSTANSGGGTTYNLYSRTRITN